MSLLVQVAEKNAPWVFWRLLDADVSVEDWRAAGHEASSLLVGLDVDSTDPAIATSRILSEAHFGADHWTLSRPKSLYYQLRRFLPPAARALLRRLFLPGVEVSGPLGWPVEDRFVRFQLAMIGALMERKQLDSLSYLHFWPNAARFAFVLTHDIESARGQSFVRDVASLEERHGFRSSFNFVAEDYDVDLDLISELKERGFEVGVHGLSHDGRLFSSERRFRAAVPKINDYLRKWDARGFRSPSTHRQPEWMQALAVDYDLSFFDTDPFEPISGGTMSIWPFHLGHFVELPYTLAQDHTLMVTLGESTPRLWLEKVDFIERHCGMALVNTHPDYLLVDEHFRIYETFLRAVQNRRSYWHALPKQVATWWRMRGDLTPSDLRDAEKLDGSSHGTVAEIRRGTSASKTELVLDQA